MQAEIDEILVHFSDFHNRFTLDDTDNKPKHTGLTKTKLHANLLHILQVYIKQVLLKALFNSCKGSVAEQILICAELRACSSGLCDLEGKTESCEGLPEQVVRTIAALLPTKLADGNLTRLLGFQTVHFAILCKKL